MKSPGKSRYSRLLNELHSRSTKDFIDIIDDFLQELETKNDPDTVDIFIAENLNQLLEKFKMLESNLTNYVKEQRKALPGNKITELKNYKDENMYEE